jgi:energy-coupling factor transport system ATP-binding protein
MPVETIDLRHVYMSGTSRAIAAVDGVSLVIGAGEAVGIMGPTGSGKSTLVQHFNGLLRPTSGRILVDGVDLWNGAKAALRSVRRKVGLIFQFPEHQLFEETVFDDIAFGPRNLGLPEEEIKSRVGEAMEIVGLGGEQAEVIGRRSPFGLSGGQMRRVAIAGVLAMRPSILVLDEPTAGLDPRGRQGLLETLLRLHHESGLTLVVVSHNMEDLARLVDRVVVLERGKVALEGPAREVFSRADRLRTLGLDAPPPVRLLQAMAGRGATVRTDLLAPAPAAEEILRWLKEKERRPVGTGGRHDDGAGDQPADGTGGAGGGGSQDVHV